MVTDTAFADAVAARWPDPRHGAGHYESYYLRAFDPARPRGIWIRYTVLAAPGARPDGELWFTLFDRDAPGPRASRVPAGPPATGDGAWIRFADGAFGPDLATGTAASPGGTVSWRLRHRGPDEPLLHLPHRWMYTARLPRTKLTSPRPVAVFDGELEIDGEPIAVDGWPGMVGHNWGEEHANRWIWLNGLSLAGADGPSWLDVAIGRVRLSQGVVTPWVANGALSIGGRRFALGGLGRRTAVVAEPDRCSLRLHGRGITVTAQARAPRSAFAEWDYPGPDGSPSRVLNCSVADLRLRVQRRGHEPVLLAGNASAVYEHGAHVDAGSPF